jgi:murein DD-endopeptidase MepM/ murein hydrolase activator NlpD
VTKIVVSGLTLFQILFIAGVLHASATGFSGTTHILADQSDAGSAAIIDVNSQKMPLLEAPTSSVSTDDSAADLVMADDDATGSSSAVSVADADLEAADSSTSPSTADTDVSNTPVADSSTTSGTQTDDGSYKVITYTVKSGDTLSGIAEHFGISTKTILQANSAKATSKLKVGQTLTILPVDGIQYTVVSGDSLGSIAAQYNASVSDILVYNGLTKDSIIKSGQTLLIPNATAASASDISSAGSVKSTIKKAVQKVADAALGVKVADADTSALADGYYMRPIKAGVKTQGIHDNNAVDLADACGTAVYASAAGTVTVAKDNNAWNGGFGNYVEINHDNGSQTLYAHFEKTEVSVGDQVAQGQEIGKMGETGEATGCHVHFEIHDGPVNPF